MADIGRQAIVSPGPIGTISTIGYESLGYGIAQAGMDFIFSGGASTTSGQVYAFPFALNTFESVYGFAWVNAASPSGTIDCGIYDPLGNLIVSMGNQTMSGASSRQAHTCTTTTLDPGNYYLAFSTSAAQGIAGTTTTNMWMVQVLAGMQLVASGGNPLPSTLTFVSPSANVTLYWIVAYLFAGGV